MISYIQGKVLFSDGQEVVIVTSSGIGYQVFFRRVLAEGSLVALYISHMIKEDSQNLYGFLSLREKKLFEMLNSVKGVGPKSAFTLTSLGVNLICDAITYEDKKGLAKAPGIGTKASAQIVLDLQNKIHKIKMYSNQTISPQLSLDNFETEIGIYADVSSPPDVKIEERSDHDLLDDTIMACKELGFKEEKIMIVARKILDENSITKAEQLVHLVLKEI